MNVSIEPLAGKHIETAKCIFTQIEGGIIRIEVKAHSHIDLDDLNENFAIYSNWVENNDGLFLIVTNIGVSSSTKARMEFSNYNRAKVKKAEAVVVKSTLIRVMANFQKYVSKPDHEIKIFTKEPEAIKWLLQYQ